MLKELSQPQGKVGRLTSKHITTMGMVLAVRFIIGFIPSLNYGNYVRLGFGFIGSAFSGIMLGPWYGFILGALYDIFDFFLVQGGGPFFPGYTLSAALGPMIYGFFLWRRETTWKHYFLAVTVVTFLINIGLGSIWVRMLSGEAWNVFMPMRIAKNLFSWPFNTLVLTLIFEQPTIKKLIKDRQF